LPADVSGFAGRSAALKALDDFLDEDQISRPVVITAIAGAAGVGKTALAVHWAHRVAAHFPDGQLYVNLKGFDPSGELTTPAEAVRGFLNALAVPKERIPAGLDAQAALYRSSLSGKRVLVVLDNARDAEQVRPLLPGSTGCLAVVTSRHQLFGLVASEGARPVPLDVLADEEARQLIAGRIGADRTAAEPEAVDAIVAACAGLPLALAVAAARAAVSPATTLAELAGQLHDSLDAFGGDDEAVNLRAVFSWSYRTLEAETARLFRLLGLFPGPDVSLPAAASLAGAPVRETRARLAQLRDAHLIVEHVPGRYTLHDLLRTYAWELTRQRDSADDRRAAQRRLFDWLLHTALAAELLINPSRDPIALSAPAAGVVVAPPTEYQSAFDWFDVERTVLLAAVDSAAASGSDDHAWQLAWTLNTFLNYQGYWREWIESQQTALGAATRQSNRPAQARIHCQQSQAVLTQPGTCDEARAHLDAALALYVELDDVAGQGRVHMSLGGLARRMEREEAALEHNLLALERYRAAGYERGAALALNNAGWHHAQLGDLGRAMECCREALDVYEQLDDPHGEAIILDSLGYIRERLGDHRESVACYRSAVEKFRDSGDRYNEAKTLSRLADVCRAADDAAGARDCYKRALDVFEDLGLSDAERIRAELDRLSSDA
ncbi:MAG: ATP-binding protein, partial [Stackebrandtia sp.]